MVTVRLASSPTRGSCSLWDGCVRGGRRADGPSAAASTGTAPHAAAHGRCARACLKVSTAPRANAPGPPGSACGPLRTPRAPASVTATSASVPAPRASPVATARVYQASRLAGGGDLCGGCGGWRGMSRLVAAAATCLPAGCSARLWGWGQRHPAHAPRGRDRQPLRRLARARAVGRPDPLPAGEREGGAVRQPRHLHAVQVPRCAGAARAGGAAFAGCCPPASNSLPAGEARPCARALRAHPGWRRCRRGRR